MRHIAADTPDSEAEIRRLNFDLDVDVCVVGAGLAGLSVALEAAQLGASVAVLERRRIAWGASGHHLGTVMPGFDVPPEDVIARIGRRAAGELWRMSQTGAEIVRLAASSMPDVVTSEGALEVSPSGIGNRRLVQRQELGSDFGYNVTPWELDRVREALNSRHYFRALHHPRAFGIDAHRYLLRLSERAQQAGVRIFEESPVTELDVTGTRKRVTTPLARMRAAHVVLAGNVHLGSAMPRLAGTLLPLWRYGALTEPLGDRLADAVTFRGSVFDTDGIDHFRIVQGDRLMWSGPQLTWEMQPGLFAGAIRRRMRRLFPTLPPVKIERAFSGAIGRTVHGMPQIGQIRPGLWVASGFGAHGLNTTAMAGRIVARGILWGDDRWRLFGPFDLIWAGGRTGRVAGAVIDWTSRGRAAFISALARRRETIERQTKARQMKAASLRTVAAPAAPARSRQSEQELPGAG